MNRQVLARLGRVASSPRVGALLLLASPLLARAEMDLAPITAAGVTIGLVGAAVYAVHVAIKVFAWVRRAT